MPAFTAPMSLRQQVIIYALALKDTGIVIDLPFPDLDSVPSTHSDKIVGTINSHYYPQMTSNESQ
jgi:hypothetical protein